jgi:hypothetical protein
MTPYNGSHYGLEKAQIGSKDSGAERYLHIAASIGTLATIVASIIASIILSIKGLIGMEGLIFLLGDSILLLLLFVLFYSLAQLRKQINSIEFPKEKFDRIKTKYDIELKPMLIQEYSDDKGIHRVKIGLIKGVQHNVYATYTIDIDSHLPSEEVDERNYFDGNKAAHRRIRKNHLNDDEYNIHRIFIISQAALDHHKDRLKIRAAIEHHIDADFDIKLIRKEDLPEQLPYEFAIYDDEIVFRLSLGPTGKVLDKGRTYFDDAIVQEIFKEGYREIEARSFKPHDFWQLFPIR